MDVSPPIHLSSCTTNSHNTKFLHQPFHHFPKLPIELRLKIWEKVQPVPRVVPIRFDERLGYTSPARIPPILHVSHESRMIGLKNYQLRFSGEPDDEHDASLKAEAKIYFNFDHDIPYFGYLNDNSAMGPFTGYRPSLSVSCETKLNMTASRDDIRRIRRLAVNDSSMQDLNSSSTDSQTSVRRTCIGLIDNIKEIYLVSECQLSKKVPGDQSGDLHLANLDIEWDARLRLPEKEGFFNQLTMFRKSGIASDLAVVLLRREKALLGLSWLVKHREVWFATKEVMPLVVLRYLLSGPEVKNDGEHCRRGDSMCLPLSTRLREIIRQYGGD